MNAMVENLYQFLLRDFRPLLFDEFQFLPVEDIVETLGQPHVCNLGGIGNKRELGVVEVIVAGFGHNGRQEITQTLAFLIDVLIVAPREIDTFEGTVRRLLGRVDLGEGDFAGTVDNHGRTGCKEFNLIVGNTECSLNHRPLGSDHQDFVIVITERRTDSPRIAECETFSGTSHAADAITAIP